MRNRGLESLVLVLALSLFAVGCGGNDETPKPQVNERGLIVCSETCANHGQCATLPSSRKAVLANRGGPAVSLHDFYLPDNTVAEVTEINERQLLPAQDGLPITANATPFPHLFYRVTTSDGTAAWVSDWCIEKAE